MKYKMLIVSIVLLLLNILTINADYQRNITDIQCYSDTIVKVNSNNINFNDYNIIGCNNYKDNYWKCKCDYPNTIPIILNIKNSSKNMFNIVIEYYVSKDINDDNKRTLFFNDININYKQPKIKKSFVMPELKNINIMLGIVFLIIVICIIFISYMYKIFFKDDKKEKKQNIDYINDEEEEKIRKIINDL